MPIAGHPTADRRFTPEKSFFPQLKRQAPDRIQRYLIVEIAFSRDFFDMDPHVDNVGKEAGTQQMICDLQDCFLKADGTPRTSEQAGSRRSPDDVSVSYRSLLS